MFSKKLKRRRRLTARDEISKALTALERVAAQLTAAMMKPANESPSEGDGHACQRIYEVLNQSIIELEEREVLESLNE